VARIAPLPEPDWGEDLGRILASRPPGAGRRLGDNNIFPTLARHERLFKAWLPFGGFLLGRGVIPARERELVILRTARNCGSSYEWGQHVVIGEAAGLSREEIERVASSEQGEGFDEADVELLRAADELHRDAKISPETWSLLASRHDEPFLIELTMLVGHYHLVAFALNSLEVELDDGLEPLP
jgi:alkylhydroperoxidase family enzyme